MSAFIFHVLYCCLNVSTMIERATLFKSEFFCPEFCPKFLRYRMAISQSFSFLGIFTTLMALWTTTGLMGHPLGTLK